MEISTKTHLLELSTMIHVVRNQIKSLLVNERPRDISLARSRDLICRVYQSVNDVSVSYYIFQRQKNHSARAINQSHPGLVSRTCLATHFITDTK